MRFLITLLLLLSTTLSYAKVAPEVKKALAPSVQIIIVGQGAGSGFAFARDERRKKTLIMTADHVCQQSRGTIGPGKYAPKPLNTHPIEVIDTNRKTYIGRVAFTTGVTLKNEELSQLSRADLCIVEIVEPLPLAEISTEFLALGEEVISVSGPNGTFPLIHKGYAGDLQLTENKVILQYFTLNVTVGSSGGAIFSGGKVIGVIIAIEPIGEDVLVAVSTIGIPSRYIIQLYAQYRVSLLKGVLK
jgi:hypothetical protein